MKDWFLNDGILGKTKTNKTVFNVKWILKYLGIFDDQLIKQYEYWHSQDGWKKLNKLKFFDNSKMRRSLGLYWPDSNNVVVTSNLLKDKTANSLELVAHEFAHSLIGHKEKPWITHDGHGPSFYYRLMRYVVWSALNIPKNEKFKILENEFCYSCRVIKKENDIKLIVNYSKADSISSFTINDFLNSSKNITKEIGEWFLEIFSQEITNISKEQLLKTPLSELIDLSSKSSLVKNIEIKKVSEQGLSLLEMFTLSHNIKFPIKQEKKCEYFIFKDIQNNETIGFFKCLVVNQACYIDICILKHRSDCDTIDQCLKLVFEYIKKLNVDHIFFGKHFFIDRMHKLNYNFNIKNELAIFKNKHYIECEKSKW